MSKEKSPRKIVAEKKRKAFLAKAEPAIIKLVAGVAVVASTFLGMFMGAMWAIENYPKVTAMVMALITTLVLLLAIARCENK